VIRVPSFGTVVRIMLERRAALAEVEDVLRVIDLGGRLLADGFQGRDAQGEGESDKEDLFHPTISLIGLPGLSTMRMGRPTLELFCFSWSNPSAQQTVARKSGP
jgi:hypothetical protein